MSSMIDAIETQFAEAGRTPKGRQALRAIFRATRDVMTEVGLPAASLDLIAQRANLTQAAVRHYFPTRDDLLMRFFLAGSEWLTRQLSRMVEAEHRSPGERLEKCLDWHLEFMEQVDTANWLEMSAFALRRKAERRVRTQWYRWLAGQYAVMIGEIQPSLGSAERKRRAHVILTLVLGAWLTHGRGSAFDSATNPSLRRQQLVAAAMGIATQH